MTGGERRQNAAGIFLPVNSDVNGRAIQTVIVGSNAGDKAVIRLGDLYRRVSFSDLRSKCSGGRSVGMVQGTADTDTPAVHIQKKTMSRQMTKTSRFRKWVLDLREALGDYFGSPGRSLLEPITDRTSLQRVLATRSSFVAQTSLYGYMRTRAGVRYPELFEDEGFIRLLNVAKWHVWLACLSDLAVFTGGLLRQHATTIQVGTLMRAVVSAILDETGIPADAGEEFAAHADRVRARLAACDWDQVTDDEGPFSESPTALVRWAPIVENLKELDEEIVRNSVRFRWQEIRRELRRDLDAEAVLGSAN